SEGMDAIRERLHKLELLVGEPRVEDPGQTVLARLDDSEERFKQVLLDMISFTDTLRRSIKVNQEEISILKKALCGSFSRVEGHSKKFKVPQPEPFNGRDAKFLENFLWDMEQYLGATRVPDVEKVPITSVYLSGDAKLWWRTRVLDNETFGRPRI
ncbi:LOW QUALITY PROTEIN: hypothetical protein CFOL_v3_26734, partial [Cephalotus follicularis]